VRTGVRLSAVSGLPAPRQLRRLISALKGASNPSDIHIVIPMRIS
jgi:hypothetical protein